MRARAWILAIALLLGASVEAKSIARSPKAHSATSRSLATPTTKLLVGKSSLLTEIVDNDSLRAQGLSGRQSLEWNSGMLFVFPDTQSRTFWMIDCAFDLDIAYLDPRGIVRDIQTMKIEPGVPPNSLARYTSKTSDIMYALEVNRGWLSASDVKVGDRIPAISRFRTDR